MVVYEVIDLTKVYPRQTVPANDRLTLSVMGRAPAEPAPA